jgi:hypothetical protein
MIKGPLVDVRVSHDETGDWMVWLEEEMVARFISVSEALALATLLECSPRARSEVRSEPA